MREPQRALRTLVFALCTAALAWSGQRQAAAQVALEQYQPAPLASDGFVLGRPTLLKRRAWALLLGADYANDPLVLRVERGARVRQVVVGHHFAVQMGGALGLHRRVMLFANLPVHAVMRGDRDLLVPNSAADGAALGDLTLAMRIALAGDDDTTLALAGEIVARVPLAELSNSSQRYAGDSLGSYEGALIGELRKGMFAVRLRLGARLRAAHDIQNLELGQQLVFGTGALLRLRRSVALHAELSGSTYLARAFDDHHTPLELLLGPKIQHRRWWFGAAVGPGLVHSYGSPDFRALASVGFGPPARAEQMRQQTTTSEHGSVDGRDAALDESERCRHASGIVERQGCPAGEAYANSKQPVKFGRVEFATDQDASLPSSIPTLSAVQSILSLNSQITKTRIEGHADDTGDAAYNQELSERRARAAARWLLAHGIAADRLELSACGQRHPTVAGSTDAARQRNRRVEFHVREPAYSATPAHAGCAIIALH